MFTVKILIFIAICIRIKLPEGNKATWNEMVSQWFGKKLSAYIPEAASI